MSKPEELHEWISFADPDTEQTWMIDATFLRSNWTCIYGNGCQGILDDADPTLHQGCCSYGAHFIDKEDLASVKKSVKRLKPEHWQNYDRGQQGKWLGKEKDGSDITTLYKGACIFHNRNGFSGGEGCALHLGALAYDESPIDWKPSVCWQLPIKVDWVMRDDDVEIATVRGWKKSDWGDHSEKMAWVCTEEPEAYVGEQPVIESLADELTAIVGKEVFVQLRQRFTDIS